MWALCFRAAPGSVPFLGLPTMTDLGARPCPIRHSPALGEKEAYMRRHDWLLRIAYRGGIWQSNHGYSPVPSDLGSVDPVCHEFYCQHRRCQECPFEAPQPENRRAIRRSEIHGEGARALAAPALINDSPVPVPQPLSRPPTGANEQRQPVADFLPSAPTTSIPHDKARAYSNQSRGASAAGSSKWGAPSAQFPPLAIRKTPSIASKKRQQEDAEVFSDASAGRRGKGKKRCRIEAVTNGKLSERPVATNRKRRLRTIHPTKSSLACPFDKRNPKQPKKCAKYVLSTISHVKQHLRRVHHRAGPLCAASCAVASESDINRGVHLRHSAECQPEMFDGVLTNAQMEDLNTNAKRKEGDRNQWFALWDLLFPGEPQPDSHYHEDDEEGDVSVSCADLITSLLTYVGFHGLDILKEFGEEQSHTQLLVIIQIIQKLGEGWQKEMLAPQAEAVRHEEEEKMDLGVEVDDSSNPTSRCGSPSEFLPKGEDVEMKVGEVAGEMMEDEDEKDAVGEDEDEDMHRLFDFNKAAESDGG
ncbi:hypothetical protein QBC46DRAFT_417350 [Diplogelasinospora grovesii]|uniref:C2H2-type domain-containing protein n=1 Tax=Diplogelasinospora grovesii TaxID=303347 RepID=A0AAN6N0Z5_9PEZI|nr:hypothetical protein QBC46DRAFT_417350 [Diplogelasinospora grovesii]